jgi:hypothetical protein
MERIPDSLVESVDVACDDGQLVVTVAFQRDAEFEAELTEFIAAIEAREYVLEQPATRRSKRILVAVTAGTGSPPRTDFRVLSGGTGTETIAVWRFDRDTAHTISSVSVQADGRTIFRGQCPPEPRAQ